MQETCLDLLNKVFKERQRDEYSSYDAVSDAPLSICTII